MQIPYRKPGKYSQTPNDPLMTKDKIVELQNKLNKLKKSQPSAASEVTRLAQLGDFSENAEYQHAKGRLRGINESILRLEHQLNHAEIIDTQTQKDKIELGNTVTVSVNHEEKKYKILGSTETDPKRGIISYNSPIGAALLGHRIGETVKISLADKNVEYQIIKIE